jgi:hypothetical protein
MEVETLKQAMMYATRSLQPSYLLANDEGSLRCQCSCCILQLLELPLHIWHQCHGSKPDTNMPHLEEAVARLPAVHPVLL